MVLHIPVPYQRNMKSVAVTLLKNSTLSSSESEEDHKKKSWGIRYGKFGDQVIGHDLPLILL